MLKSYRRLQSQSIPVKTKRSAHRGHDQTIGRDRLRKNGQLAVRVAELQNGQAFAGGQIEHYFAQWFTDVVGKRPRNGPGAPTGQYFDRPFQIVRPKIQRENSEIKGPLRGTKRVLSRFIFNQIEAAEIVAVGTGEPGNPEAAFRIAPESVGFAEIGHRFPDALQADRGLENNSRRIQIFDNQHDRFDGAD
ncbi:MAG: hypothetical protein JSS81_28070 [Acidobacteria bacterium]|nr:hypothetical protein [Acidobacteriota bacterium]